MSELEILGIMQYEYVDFADLISIPTIHVSYSRLYSVPIVGAEWVRTRRQE